MSSAFAFADVMKIMAGRILRCFGTRDLHHCANGWKVQSSLDVLKHFLTRKRDVLQLSLYLLWLAKIVDKNGKKLAS